MRILIFIFLLVIPISVNGQKFKKLGLKKAAGALQKAVEKTLPEDENTSETSDGKDEDVNSSSEKKTLNKKMSKDDILASLDASFTAYEEKDYASVRYSIQELLVEIENRLGKEVLGVMPEEVLGIPYDKENDKVLSTGAGFAGLNIQREYYSNEGEISVTIANNSAMMNPYSMALSSPQMIAQEENMKIVTVNGKRSILELDEYENSFSIYTPFGESSGFVMDCKVCADENETIATAELFDLDSYLQILGEEPIEFDSTK